MSGVPKRRLEEFTLDEISAVDRPAQEGALAMILKREEALDSFEKRIDEIVARDGITKLDAMRRARVEYSQEFDAYQRRGAISSRPSFEKKERSRDVQEFELIIDGIAEREGVGKDEAMRRARRQHPDKYERYQAA